MSELAVTGAEAAAPRPPLGADGSPPGAGRGLSALLPTPDLVSTKLLELRKRTGLMITVVLLTVGFPVLVLGIRLLLHAVDPSSFGPAGSPGLFSGLTNAMAEFGFIIAATVGATAGATDLSEGVFRQLVVTGRNRVALYLARIPAGLSILVPLAGAGFAVVCLVTSFAGLPEPTAARMNGVSVPMRLSEGQLESWLLTHPNQATQLAGLPLLASGGGSGAVAKLGPSSPAEQPAAVRKARAEVRKHIGTIYSTYTLAEVTQSNPAVNEMAKIGAWLELEVAIGFLAGLGLGSLTGQRTVSTISLIALQLIVTPILAANVIPYFINGQRLVVGLAMDQLRPIALGSANGGGGPRAALFGGRGALSIPPMPTWAMVAVIVGWMVVWSAVGAFRMARRDA